MDRTERFYKIELFIREQPGISSETLRARLDVSRATLHRDLEYLRDRLNAPILFDRDLGGYRLDLTRQRAGDQYELPGLWFSAEEVHALLTMQHLLGNLDTGGLLGPHIKPLLARLTAILGGDDNSAAEVARRIRIQTVGAREFHLDHFQLIGSALLRRKRLALRYNAKGSGETSERVVSPQRLVYYRDNWYLDAWCHLRGDLRSFAVDSVTHADTVDAPARAVADKTLNRILGSGYGIFSGKTPRHATLRFTAERARWVATERWHADQKGRLLKDGRYELRVPYHQDHELLMDILKYGADCEVVGPAELKKRVAAEIRRMFATLDPEKLIAGSRHET